VGEIRFLVRVILPSKLMAKAAGQAMIERIPARLGKSASKFGLVRALREQHRSLARVIIRP
jgi:hypothetical protein